MVSEMVRAGAWPDGRYPLRFVLNCLCGGRVAAAAVSGQIMQDDGGFQALHSFLKHRIVLDVATMGEFSYKKDYDLSRGILTTEKEGEGGNPYDLSISHFFYAVDSILPPPPPFQWEGYSPMYACHRVQ